jgi:hypothetical protein
MLDQELWVSIHPVVVDGSVVSAYTWGERPKPGSITSGRPRPISIGVANALRVGIARQAR